uniref:Phosphoinositide phospholipase C n=1 Tax=Paramormyrops kingsleyae TaxID=1676925 RepID=A0A3B3QUP1_9TELE
MSETDVLGQMSPPRSEKATGTVCLSPPIMSSRRINRQGSMQYCRHFLADNSAFHVERCMSVMQSGTQMVKLKSGSKGLVRLFYLDEHRSCIRWRPSRKSEKAKITIDSLYKVTEGRQSDIFHRYAEGNFDPGCCFTIYHGNHMESLDVVTSNPEEARTWVTGLRYLMAGISDEDSLARRQRTHDQWMKQTFEEADRNGDGLLNIEEIYQLLHKINVNLPRRKVKQMFQEADTDDQQGTLTYEEFNVFYKMMSLRRDLYLLMMAYSDKKEYLTAEELGNFLQVEQKMTNITLEYCLDIIDKFEVSDDNKQKFFLGIEGFTNFMRSPTCDIFNPLHHQVNQDMDQPLCNYYVASSHNTYLTGDQLLSHSKADMYAWVLQNGCRCVEVDCWDGPDGDPMVQHGYTLTSKITFKSVIETINKYAFINNEYPVILSLENHCSIQQQKKMARYLQEILGDKLDLGPVNIKEMKQLPSPNLLKGKILIKGKRLPPNLSADAEEGEVSDDDSADEIEDGFKLKSSSNGHNRHQVESFIRKKLDSLMKESQIGDKEDTDSFSIRALLQATHKGLDSNFKQKANQKEGGKRSQSRSFISNLKQKRHSKSRLKCQSVDTDEDGQQDGPNKDTGQFHRRRRKTMKLTRDLSTLVVFTNSIIAQESLEESTPSDVLSFSETQAQHLVHQQAERFVRFNQQQLSRIYPSAYRIDSSNFNPQTYWNMGCHLVALNYQTEGRMMQLNRAKFQVNGDSGYVLKPPPMCKGSFNPFSSDPLPAYPKKQLVLKIISGQQLPKPPDSMLGDRGEIIDPFVEVEIIGLPIDCCKEQTRVVDDNGFNPVWEETLSFTLHMAELTLVRFLVWDHDPIGRDFVGQRTVAFSSLMPGYRHVYLEGLTEASIFIHVAIHDIFGKGRQLRGIKGLFSRSSRSCVDTPLVGPPLCKRSISQQLLRRTASAPAKGRRKTKRPPAPPTEGEDGEGGAPPPSCPLLPRPASMPLDKLLQDTLTLSSPRQDAHEAGSNPPAETTSVLRPRSSSLNLLLETPSSYMARPKSPPHVGGEVNPAVRGPHMDRLYDLSLGGEQDRLTDTAEPTQHRIGQNQPNTGQTVEEDHLRGETVCGQEGVTTETLESSAGPVNRVNLLSDSSLQDSTLSRLIDAVSLGNDTCGSISALIGQFDVTAELSSVALRSSDHDASQTPCRTSACDSCQSSGPSNAVLFSSPETTDLTIYTILNEEVLSPISEFSPGENTVRSLQMGSEESTPVASPAPSPVKPLLTHKPLFSRKQAPYSRAPEVPCGQNPCFRPIAVREEVTWGSHGGSFHSAASDRFLLCQDSAGSSLMEIEINVDEDPLDVTLTPSSLTHQLAGPRPPSTCGPLNHSPLHHIPGNFPLSSTRTDPHRSPSSWIHGPTPWRPSHQSRCGHQMGDKHLPAQGTIGHHSGHASSGSRPFPLRINSTMDQAASRSSSDWPPGSRMENGHFLQQGHPAIGTVVTSLSPSPGPCKSKSLGDLTSEDISCNFESKYKFINRSFMAARAQSGRQASGPARCPAPADPLTEQLRRLVSLDQDEHSQNPDLLTASPLHPLSRKLSSRSQSRVRHIASRARERQQEALKPRPTSASYSTTGVVLRSKPANHNPPACRHSTGSYIAGYLEHSEGRGLPEGSCTKSFYANGDQRCHGDASIPVDWCQPSEPEVYFLLRL